MLNVVQKLSQARLLLVFAAKYKHRSH